MEACFIPGKATGGAADRSTGGTTPFTFGGDHYLPN
jgi:hypothetical protein